MFGRYAELRSRLEAVEERVEGLGGLLDGIDARIKRILQGEDGLASRSELATLSSGLEELRTAVAHGIENVERRENRIRSTVGRALKVLDEHGFDPSPGLEAEARGLFGEHEGRGEAEGVQPVREDLESSRVALEALEGIPGHFGAEDFQTVLRRRGASLPA